MPGCIAIVGAGLIGRILALECHFAGFNVSLFDRDDKEGKLSCAYTGAGMLAPYTELEASEPIIAALGIESLDLWPILLKRLKGEVFFQREGTLIVAHPQDEADLERFGRHVKHQLQSEDWVSLATPHTKDPLIHYNLMDLADKKIHLSRAFSHAFYVPAEGQIDNKQLIDALKHSIDDAKIEWHTNSNIDSFNQLEKDFDFVIDCRGLGAKNDLDHLRGVRGELVMINAPEVDIPIPIRLMHPRHPIYIVPRKNNNFIVGATSIESADQRSITVQSVLELLSAACTVHQGFAEANIVETRVNNRPTLLDNLPAIIHSKKNKIVRINGLYRHGFLVAPKLAQLILALLQTGLPDKRYKKLFQNAE